MDNSKIDNVLCPLVDAKIDRADCWENSDVVDDAISPESMPGKYKQKADWQEICKKCQWHDY